MGEVVQAGEKKRPTPARPPCGPGPERLRTGRHLRWSSRKRPCGRYLRAPPSIERSFATQRTTRHGPTAVWSAPTRPQVTGDDLDRRTGLGEVSGTHPHGTGSSSTEVVRELLGFVAPGKVTNGCSTPWASSATMTQSGCETRMDSVGVSTTGSVQGSTGPPTANTQASSTRHVLVTAPERCDTAHPTSACGAGRRTARGHWPSSTAATKRFEFVAPELVVERDATL